MAFKLLNRVRMSLTGSAGTGTLTPNTAAVGFQSMVAAGMTDGDTTSYVIEDGSPVGSSWEIGVGTWHSNGTFSRDTLTQSSAGGKLSVTSSAILSGGIRAQDLMAAPPISGALTAPTVVQHQAITQEGLTSAYNVIFASAVTPGNIILFVGNADDTDGTNGFNVPAADFQNGQASTTARSIGFAYKLAKSGDGTTFQTGTSTNPIYGFALELSGATISALTSAMWANGAFTSSASSVTASAPGNSLEVEMAACTAADTITVTTPASLQISAAPFKAGWHTTATSDTNTITGTIATGANGAFVIAIPGT